MKTNSFYFIIMSMMGLVGCAGHNIHGNDKVVAKSSSSMPEWVEDSANQDQKRLIKYMDDNVDNPKYYYLVSQSHVDNESLVPSCYNFARSHAANELGSAINQEIHSTVSSSSDASFTSNYAVSTVQTKAALVGSQIMARYWDKTQDKEGNEKVNCWVLNAIPYKNYNQLKEQAIKQAGKTHLDKEVKERAEKAQSALSQ